MQLHLPGRCPWRRSCSHCRHPPIYWGNDIWRRASPVLQRSATPAVLWLYNIPELYNWGHPSGGAIIIRNSLLYHPPACNCRLRCRWNIWQIFCIRKQKCHCLLYVNTQSTIKLYVNKTNFVMFGIIDMDRLQTEGIDSMAHRTGYSDCEGRFVY